MRPGFAGIQIQTVLAAFHKACGLHYFEAKDKDSACVTVVRTIIRVCPDQDRDQGWEAKGRLNRFF
jgi:hypothetical protein